MRDAYKVVVFEINDDSLQEIHIFTFQHVPIKFRQSPFYGIHFSVLTEKSLIYDISIVTGTKALVAQLNTERQLKVL